MSNSIDEKVVAMKFNNGQFQNGVADTLKSLDSLKKGLNMDGATKGLTDLQAASSRFNLGGLGAVAEGVSGKFIAMATVGITALANITTAALSAGAAVIKSLTVDPIMGGLREYETQLNSIQTILANTQSKGTNLDQVNAALQELNTYADKTIYNFSEMTRNIGTFTAAGVDLNTSVQAIKGIANLAALSGSNSQQASTAMYQLSQALSTGTVKLMDWNSVVNAGMGGQLFQDAIKQTARVHGVAVDEIIDKNGSFRDSLQEGWLTSEILTETLSKLTGDLTDVQLEAMGYTREQIVEIQKMAQTASDAATKVKTATQLIETLQEAVGSGWAQTWQLLFGDFEEAKMLFTGISDALGPLIQASADSRNNLLKGWNELGGRAKVIEALSNVFKILMGIVKSVREAFTDIFPPMTAQQLMNITNVFADFIKSIMPGEVALENLYRTAKGVFAVFDIGWTIIKLVVTTLADLIGFTAQGSSGILEFTAIVGDWLVKMRDAIKSGEGLNKFFAGVGTVIKVPIDLIKRFIGYIVELIKSGEGIDTSGIGQFFGTLADRMNPLVAITNFLRVAWENFRGVLEKVFGIFAPLVEIVGGAVKEFAAAIKESISVKDFDVVLDALNVGLLGGLVILIKKFIDFFTDSFKKLDISGGFGASIKSVFGGLTDTLQAMQGQLKAKTLITIAGAVALLTVSVVALSLIDSAKLASALTGLTVMFGQLLGAMAIMDKVVASKGFVKIPAVAAGLILIASAALILASAVAILAALDWNELARGLVGLGGVLAALLITMDIISKNEKKFAVSAVSLIGLATAVRILAESVTELAGNSWEELAKGVLGVAAVLAILAGFTKLVGNPANIIAISFAMILLGTALLLIGNAVAIFASMNWEELARGLIGMGIALGIITTAMVVMGATLPTVLVSAAALVIVSGALMLLGLALKQMGGMSWDEIGRGLTVLAASLLILAVSLILMTASLPGSAALLIASVALIALAAAMQMMAKLSWDDIGRAMVVLGGSLAILAVGLTLMVASLPGAAALLVAAGALMILAPALILMASMSWDDIGRGMAVLAAAIGILAIGGMLLIPAIPGLLGLGAAVLLLGVGAMAAGLGVSALAIGLTALTVAGGAGITVLVAAISALAGLIPYVAEQIGIGILAIATVISTGGPEILAALTTILLALIAAIVAIIPPLVDAIVLMVTKLVEAIVVLVPLLVDAGLRLIIGILDGVANNIGMIIDKGTDVIVAFLEGIGRALPRLMQAGADLIIDFVNGLANTIRNNTSRMNAAGSNLANAIIEGMVSGIWNGISTIINAVQDMANGALQAAKDVLGINSPSKEFEDIGMYTDQGLAIGIDKHGNVVTKAADNLGKNAISAVSKSLEGMADAINSNMDMSPTVRPIMDLTGFKKDAASISSMFGDQSLSMRMANSNAYSASAGYEENVRVATDADGKPTDDFSKIEFNQYNSSPKALSKAEIYRQTKSQIALAEERLGKK